MALESTKSYVLRYLTKSAQGGGEAKRIHQWAKDVVVSDWIEKHGSLVRGSVVDVPTLPMVKKACEALVNEGKIKVDRVIAKRYKKMTPVYFSPSDPYYSRGLNQFHDKMGSKYRAEVMGE